MTKREKLRVAIKALYAQFRDEIADTITQQPDKSYEAIAREFCVSLQMVQDVAKERGIRRKVDANTVVMECPA